MTTWISKRLIAGGVLLLGLAACEEGAGVDLGGTAPAVTQSAIAGGDVMVAAPRGYCVDPRRSRSGINRSLVVMARCDRLGQESGTSGREPLAVMLVTAMPLPEGTGPMRSQSLEAALEQGQINRRHNRSDIALIRVESDDLSEKFDRHFWRGAFRVNGHLIGATLYAPVGSSAAGDRGADLLEDMAQQTRRATAAQEPSS